jgi:ABC-type microcin C transport system duplicated ATPase subunit YejF
MSSLNPAFTVGFQIKEAIKIHQRLKGRKLWEKARFMLEQVKIASLKSG